jgi:hypothetical protein
MKAPKGNDVVTRNNIYPKSRYAINLKMLITVRRDNMRINVIKEKKTGITNNIRNRLISNIKDKK